jgi:pyruvate formate lyase activating enzyme
MDTRRPLIVEVKRGSLEDGPGIRSVVFFKGCPLRCVFCHNPEAQRPGPEIAFVAQRCIRCGSCAAQCQQNAIDLLSSSRIDRRRCDLCGRCAAECPSGALRLIGKYWRVDELAEFLLRDLDFYRQSGGGVTLSGGECTLFPDYVHKLTGRLKADEVHIAVETCGFFDYEVFSDKILRHVDLVLFDIKLIEPEASLRYLGQPNELMLSNLKRLLAEPGVQVRPRIPLIPGVTDTHENLAGIVEKLYEVGATEVSLLAYNPLAAAMYDGLGRAAPDLQSGFTNPEREREIVEMFRETIRYRAMSHTTRHALCERDRIPVDPAHPATTRPQAHPEA